MSNENLSRYAVLMRVLDILDQDGKAGAPPFSPAERQSFIEAIDRISDASLPSLMLGLNRISGCENPNRSIDVVFVHGLDGDAVSTWHPKNERHRFWPKMLGEDMPHIGVWSLGYEVASSAWKGTTMPLVDRATNVLDQLDIDGIGGRPIVFVCHSLGGLLVKQLLRHADDYGNPQYRRIAEQTRAIVFLSTPHSGSNIANWIKHLGTLLRTTVTVGELEAHHPALRNLNLWFRNNPRTPNRQILVYCEKHPLGGLLVVDETSADPGIQGVVPVPMDDDHVTICKPANREAQIYKRVLGLVRSVASAAPSPRLIFSSPSQDPVTPFQRTYKHEDWTFNEHPTGFPVLKIPFSRHTRGTKDEIDVTLIQEQYPVFIDDNGDVRVLRDNNTIKVPFRELTIVITRK